METLEEWFRRSDDASSAGILACPSLLNVLSQVQRRWPIWVAVAWAESRRVEERLHWVTSHNRWIDRTVYWYVCDIAPGLRWLAESGKTPKPRPDRRPGRWEWLDGGEFDAGPHTLPPGIFVVLESEEWANATPYPSFATAFVAAAAAVASATATCRQCGGTAPNVPFHCSGCAGTGRAPWVPGQTESAAWHLR